MTDVVVVGGGLAGLIASIRLSKRGISTILIEKKSYPAHKVCGEYVSNEVYPFLQREKMIDGLEGLPKINRFQLTSESGKKAVINLNMGGFGISRYKFDYELLQTAILSGVQFIQDEAREITRSKDGNSYTTHVSQGDPIQSHYVIGAYGKRSKIDKSLDRNFINQRSPWVGVKYHIDFDVPEDLITLHNFPGGYCGISRVEKGITNLCYLTKRENLQQAGSVPAMEEQILSQNPHLRKILNKARVLFDKPMVINEVSFDAKPSIENGILMIGDSSGLIAPLCGNGMAMAIHAGKIVSDIISANYEQGENRILIEDLYRKQWKKNFSRRLWFGRHLQRMFGKMRSSNGLVNLMKFSPGVAGYLVNKTHGGYI